MEGWVVIVITSYSIHYTKLYETTTRCVGRRLPLEYPPLTPLTGYDGSQASTLHDNMYHAELANPEREPTRSAQGYPMPQSFSSNDVDGRGAAVWSPTEAGNPCAPYTTGVMPATTSLTATQTRTQPTVTQQATAHSSSSQGARQGAPTAEAGAPDRQGGTPGGNDDGHGNDSYNFV